MIIATICAHNYAIFSRTSYWVVYERLRFTSVATGVNRRLVPRALSQSHRSPMMFYISHCARNAIKINKLNNQSTKVPCASLHYSNDTGTRDQHERRDQRSPDAPLIVVVQDFDRLARLARSARDSIRAILLRSDAGTDNRETGTRAAAHARSLRVTWSTRAAAARYQFVARSVWNMHVARTRLCNVIIVQLLSQPVRLHIVARCRWIRCGELSPKCSRRAARWRIMK